MYRYITTALVIAGLFVSISCTKTQKGQARENASAPLKNERKYSESPILRDRVERGELPPVEDRLPDEPLVVTPIENIGRYDSEP